MSSVIPSQLSDYKEGLLSKLKAEKSRLESTWFERVEVSMEALPEDVKSKIEVPTFSLQLEHK